MKDISAVISSIYDDPDDYQYHMFFCDNAPDPPDDPQELIAMYKQSGDRKYFRWYLHFSEQYITAIAAKFAKRHGLSSCFRDLKMIAAETIWERLDHFSFSAGVPFSKYIRRYILNAMEEFDSEVSGGFSVGSRERYVNLRIAAAIYNNTDSESFDTRVDAVALGLKISHDLAEQYIRWALTNKNMRSIYSNDDSDGDSYIPDIEGCVVPGDVLDVHTPPTESAIIARHDAEMLFRAVDKLDYRDRMMLLGWNGICPDCHKVTKKKTFEELSDDFQLSSENAARKVYLRAKDKYIRKLAAEGFFC